MGLASALVFANLGAAYGTAKSGVGICSIGVLRNDLIFKSLIPGIMAGILGIYGLIVAVIYQGKSKKLSSSSIFYGSFESYYNEAFIKFVLNERLASMIIRVRKNFDL